MTLDADRIVFVCVSLTSALGLAFSLGLVIINFKHRDDRLVKMSSPMINILMLLGAILLYLTNVIYGLASLWPIGYRLWAWLLPVSFSLLFGCLFVKSWRVNRIFTNPHRTKTVIKDVQLVLMTGALVLLDVMILTAWEVIQAAMTNQPHAEHELSSNNNESHVTRPPPIDDNHGLSQAFAHAQYTSNCTVIFVTILLLYKGIYLMYGAYLAWATRHVTIPPMDDSCCILIASHVTVISGCLAISAMSVMGAYPAARYGCVAASVWLSTTVTVTLEFAPKIHYWFKHQNDDFLKMTLSPYINQSSSPTPHTSKSTASDDVKTTCDENSSKTELEQVVSRGEHTAIAPYPETPARPLADIRMKHDSPDSGLDSPRSAVTPHQANVTLYRIENDVNVTPSTHPPLQKSCSEGSGSNCAPSDIYDIRMDSHMMRKQMYYDYLRRNRGLATQITQTYDLDSDSDTMTYISHCLSPSQSLASMPPGKSLTNELWTLESDVFYPRRQQRHAKRVKRKSRSQRSKMTSQCHELDRGSSASVV